MKKLAIALVFMSPFVVSTSFAATTTQETVSEETRVPLLEPTFTSSGQCNGAGQVYCQRERNAKRDLHEHNGRDHARR